MASKTALAKAYDAGQAAQWRNLNESVCPFEEGEERDAWLEGYSADLAEKWNASGDNLRKELGN